MIYLFYFFAVVQVFLSYQSFRGGINYLNFFKRELANPESDYTPFVSIIAPCRGLDENLSENLSALFRQNFPAYEVLFIVDSENDAAVSVIKKTISLHNDQIANRKSQIAGSKLIIAGKAANESRKVHNLREAVLHVSEQSKVLVFVDSDARPDANWLKNLIAPLRNEKIGCATGYRWFVSDKRNLASEMRSVWNASIASALGANVKSNFCWGGSMAIRRETFEKIGMRERWRGVLSDDFAVTRRMKELNLPIYFVPQALTASIENCSWRDFFEFSTRQLKITRVYAAHLWKALFVGSGIFNLVWIWGVLILIVSQLYSFAFIFTVVSLMLIVIFSVGKSHLRLKAARLVLPNCEKFLRRQFWTQNTLWIFSPAVFFYNCFRALVSRRIVWRGIEYELTSATETRLITENTTKKRLISSDG